MYIRVLVITRAMPGFHLGTKIWGGSMINEWTYLARQVPWDIFLGEFLQIISGNFLIKKQMLVV